MNHVVTKEEMDIRLIYHHTWLEMALDQILPLPKEVPLLQEQSQTLQDMIKVKGHPWVVEVT
jgi:hypothetical protein